MTALAMRERHRCGTACWAGGCAVGAIPPPEPVREQRSLAEARGQDQANGGREVTARPRRTNLHELAFRGQMALAYDTVMRRYFWRTWPEGSRPRGVVLWERAVMWRRLETGDGYRALAEHFGVDRNVTEDIVRRHETAAGWKR